MKTKNYKFSVIVPIYNTEAYLPEAIDSIINQTIGFKDNIQLILVNDGSSDRSGEICQKYQAQFPENIIYITQENAGVSAARNKGFEYATGDYVNFFDSDDLWMPKVFEAVVDFIEKNKDVGIVSLPIHFFEAKTQPHPLNFKFTKERIIDIEKEPWNILSRISDSFVRRDILDGITFDQNLKSGEDALFCLKCVLKNKKYGIVCRNNVYYKYRKRDEQSSATNLNTKRRDYFYDTLDKLYADVIQNSIKETGAIHPYIQFLLLYEASYRIKASHKNSCLTEEEWKDYSNRLLSFLKQFDNSAIIGTRFLWPEHKINLLCLKYGKNIKKWFSTLNGVLKFGKVYNVADKLNCFASIKLFEVDKNILTIAGSYSGYISEIGNVEFLINESNYKPLIEIVPVKPTEFLSEPLKHRIMFKIELPVEKFNSFSMRIVLFNNERLPLKLIPDKTSHFAPQNKTYVIDGKAFYFKKWNQIRRIKLFSRKRIKNFFSRWNWCLHNGGIRFEFYRLLVKFLKLFKRKEIWLFSDRFDKAEDNGEFLYQYVLSLKNPKIDAYYIVNNTSDDFKRIAKYGKVLDAQSFWYYIKFLMADKIISSQFSAILSNPFQGKVVPLCDLINHKFIFLSHGIHKDDISGLLNIVTRPVSLLTTTVKGEYDAIRSGKFLYSDKNVKLTGMPRYDILEDRPKKLVTIMPTWRRYLSGVVNSKTFERSYNPEFKNSSYFNFWQSLINDERILSKMQKLGYKGMFIIHPCHEANQTDFCGNNVISISKGFADYPKIKSESSLIVTDYSSAVFEYSYFKKPIVYAQADREEFYGAHTYTPGFFEYDRDGFGPVTNSYEETIAAILNYLDNNCQMEQKYKDRVDKFFTFRDKNNRQRIYEEILKL